MLNIRNRTFKVKYFGKNIIYPQKGEIYDAIIPIMKARILLIKKYVIIENINIGNPTLGKLNTSSS